MTAQEKKAPTPEGIAAAQAALEEQIAQAQTERIEAFNKDLAALQAKHGIIINPIITHNVMTNSRQVRLVPVPKEIADQFNR
ncbi:MAG: hypothetical protein ACPGVG_15255 [Mycobacterium sp.]